jgi:predicted RNase H-like HicB family nuclease
MDNSHITAKSSQRKIEIKYTFEMEDDFFVGYLDDYPEFPTQGENLKDFEANLLDIYEMIQNGTLTANQKHGVLEIAV